MAANHHSPNGSGTRKAKIFESQVQLHESGETVFQGNKYVVIETPEVFSLIRGTRKQIERSIEFINLLENCLVSGKRVVIDMSKLIEFSTDATLAVRSQLHGNDGNLSITPNSELVSRKLFDCGFFGTEEDESTPSEELRLPDGRITAWLPSGKITNNRGRTWVKHANPEIDPGKAQELVYYATQHLFGEPKEFGAVYGMLTEMMSNTFQHAAETPTGREVWWASVHYDEASKSVRFNFLDNGVGILTRIRSAWEAKYKDRPIPWKTDRNLLRAVLAGKVPSLKIDRDGGAGLPDMAERFDSGVVNNLVVLCNGTIGRKKENAYSNTNREFSGTLIHWEIGVEQREHTRVKSS